MNKDLPLDDEEPTGIFQALILYTRPSVEKNKTDVWVLTDKVWTTESSCLVVIPVFPLPPLFCCLMLFKDPLFI